MEYPSYPIFMKIPINKHHTKGEKKNLVDDDVWLKDASSSIREFSELRVRCLRTVSAVPEGAVGPVGLAMATGGESWPKISMEAMPKMDQNSPVIFCDMAILRKENHVQLTLKIFEASNLGHFCSTCSDKPCAVEVTRIGGEMMMMDTTNPGSHIEKWIDVHHLNHFDIVTLHLPGAKGDWKISPDPSSGWL